MIPEVSYPGDVYEIDVAATGRAGETIDLRGLRVGDTAGPGFNAQFIPIRRYVAVDGTGAALVTLICTTPGLAGALASGATVHIVSGAPSGLTLGTTTAAKARPSYASVFARQLARALGTSLNAADGTNNARDLTGLGLLIALGRATNLETLAECFPDTATRLLSRWERVYGLPARPDRAAAVRRARVLAKVRAAIAGTPQAIASAVAAIAGSATVYENAAVDVTANPREVFRFAVQAPAPAVDDPESYAAMAAAIQQMKPAHTQGELAESVGFLTDDDNSLTDRDVLDA